MNLFIDTPERAAERRERRWQEAGCAPSASAGSEACASPAAFGPASLFEPSYKTAVVTPEVLDLDEPTGFEDGGASVEPGRTRRPARVDRGHGKRTKPRTVERGHTSGGELLDGRVEAEPRSTAAEAYREEKAYDRRRAKKHRFMGVLRVLVMIVLLPLALATVFVGSYALTCILNGASFDEVVQLVGELFARLQAFVNDVSGFW